MAAENPLLEISFNGTVLTIPQGIDEMELHENNYPTVKYLDSGKIGMPPSVLVKVLSEGIKALNSVDLVTKLPLTLE